MALAHGATIKRSKGSLRGQLVHYMFSWLGSNTPSEQFMADQIVITEKTSQAKDIRTAVGSRYGDILPAEGHLFDLLKPEDVFRPARTRGCCAGLEALVTNPSAARRPLRHSPGRGRQQSR